MKKAIRLIGVVIMLLLIIYFNWNNILKIFYKTEYSNYVEHYSKKYNIDHLLVYAIIKAESNFEINAKSNKGAMRSNATDG